MSESPPNIVTNIHQRILSIKDELHYIEKLDKTVNNQYRFVSHDQVAAKIQPLQVKHGVNIVPNTLTCTQEGNRTVIKLAIAFVNADCPSDHFLTEWYGYGVDSGDKGPGKAASYAFKIAILKTFCLATGDDPDMNPAAVYEANKCIEFDLALPTDLTEKDKQKLDKFLSYSAECMGKHVEDVKREALSRMPDFLAAYKRWTPRKKND